MNAIQNRAVIAQNIIDDDTNIPCGERYLISMNVDEYEQALKKIKRLLWHYQQTDNITRQLVSQGLRVGPQSLTVGRGCIQKLKQMDAENKPTFYHHISASCVHYVPEDMLEHVVFSEGSIALGPKESARVEFVVYFMSGKWKAYLRLDGGHPDICTASSELEELATSGKSKLLEDDVLSYTCLSKLPLTPVRADKFFRALEGQHIIRIQCSVLGDSPVTRIYDIHSDTQVVSFCHPGTRRKIFSVKVDTQVVYNRKEGFFIFSDVGGLIRKIAPVLAYQVSL